MTDTLQDGLVLLREDGADYRRAALIAERTGARIVEGAGDGDGALELRLGADGLSLARDGMVLRGDFADMLLWSTRPPAWGRTPCCSRRAAAW